jgi:hypothetical protein
MTMVRIRTAHGYLSAQPPLGGEPNGIATLQYRATVGAWEEFDIEGLEVVVEPPPESGGGTTPEGDWLGIPPAKNAEYVAAVKAHLEAQGANLSGPCGAFAIVENVAYGLRNTGAGTFFKDGGNNCRERSTDIVAYKDLTYGCARLVDILGDGGNLNTPMWSERSEEEDITRWMPAAYPQPAPGTAGTTARDTSSIAYRASRKK